MSVSGTLLENLFFRVFFRFFFAVFGLYLAQFLRYRSRIFFKRFLVQFQADWVLRTFTFSQGKISRALHKWPEVFDFSQKRLRFGFLRIILVFFIRSKPNFSMLCGRLGQTGLLFQKRSSPPRGGPRPPRGPKSEALCPVLAQMFMSRS